MTNLHVIVVIVQHDVAVMLHCIDAQEIVASCMLHGVWVQHVDRRGVWGIELAELGFASAV